MKKFISFLLIVIFVLAGCNQQQVVTPAPVIEPTAQSEQSTQPHVVETEEPIETVVPTEEPTEIPTPTEEPVPDRCPEEALDVIPQEKLIAEVEEYAVLETVQALYVGGKQSLFLRLDTTLIEDEKVFEYTMPSTGFIYMLEAPTVLRINGEVWERVGNVVMSPEGSFIIPKGAQIEVSQEEHTGTIIEIHFVAGKVINVDDIITTENMYLSCEKEGIWSLTITNPSAENFSAEINTEYEYFITDFENLLSIKYPWAEIGATDISIGYTLTKGNVINLQPGGYIKFLLFEIYEYNPD